MAKHKAATEVTIAPTQEKSAFAAFVDRAWKPAALVAAVASAAILVYVWQRESSAASEARSWNTLLAVGDTGTPGEFEPTVEDLRAVESSLEGTVAGPWALLLLAETAFDERDYDTARQAVDELRERYPDHSLVRTSYTVGASVTPRSVVDVLEARIAAQRTWDQEHPNLFGNPDPPVDAPRVRFETSEGTILLGLYPERAPQHVENFLKLVREGYYDGTRFHLILPGKMVQGGDPNSRDDDATTWGKGGPDYEVPREENDLHHFPGALAAAKEDGAVDSLGSQFFLDVSANHEWDGEYVVYGKVLEGLEVAETLSNAPLAEGQRDRPAEPVVLQTAEVVE